MDLSDLLTLPTLIFCLMVWILVWLQRKGIGLLWKNSKENKLWNEMFMPMSPPLLGGLVAAFVKMYPFPEQFAGSLSGRVFFGAVCGLLSGYVYRIVKRMLAKKESDSGDAEGDELLGGDK